MLFCDVYKQMNIFPTLVGLLRFTSHLSNPIAIAITAVVDPMDGFVPSLSNLVECSGLWLLTLVCCTKKLYDGTDWGFSCILLYLHL